MEKTDLAVSSRTLWMGEKEKKMDKVDFSRVNIETMVKFCFCFFYFES